MDITIQKDLNIIVHEINSLLPNARVFLFGSYAAGMQKADSDLDICVVSPEFPARRMDVLHSIRDAIADKTTLPLDILLFSSGEFERNSKMKPTIEYAIAQKGIQLND
jgi:predicted nucleotidyltransferase